MQESLKKRTLQGVGWSAVDTVLGQGVSFLVGIVLARLLSPAEYGLIGICLIFVTVLTGVVDSGFSQAVIRKKDPTHADYSTMFVVNLAISVAMFILLYTCAPAIANYFSGYTELVHVLRVLGVILIIQAFSIVQMTVLTKRLDFKTKAKASFISAVASGVIGIAMAYNGYGVWSLVAQHLSKQTINTLLLWFLNSYYFSVSDFQFAICKDQWSFGCKLMVSDLLDNICNQLNQVVVAKYYSPATLGQFTKGKEYANIFSRNITTIVMRVTYPALAEIQDDKLRMIVAFRKVIKTTMLFTCICMFGLAAIAEPLIHFLIGPQWHEAATYMPLICLYMTLYPLHAINLDMLKVLGRSDLLLKLEVIKKIMGLAPLYIGFAYSIQWMLVAITLTSVLAFFLNSYYIGKDLAYGYWQQIKDVAPAYGIALAIAIPVYLLL